MIVKFASCFKIFINSHVCFDIEDQSRFGPLGGPHVWTQLRKSGHMCVHMCEHTCASIPIGVFSFVDRSSGVGQSVGTYPKQNIIIF